MLEVSAVDIVDRNHRADVKTAADGAIEVGIDTRGQISVLRFVGIVVALFESYTPVLGFDRGECQVIYQTVFVLRKVIFAAYAELEVCRSFLRRALSRMSSGGRRLR